MFWLFLLATTTSTIASGGNLSLLILVIFPFAFYYYYQQINKDKLEALKQTQAFLNQKIIDNNYQILKQRAYDLDKLRSK